MRMYLSCDCGNWGETPKGFNELKHFGVCTCGKDMYLIHGDPKEVALSDKYQIAPTMRRHGVKI